MSGKIYHAAVIGAGASGMAAACALAERGMYTALVEKNHRLGRKILSTGAGKCNFSNENISLNDYICQEKNILKRIFSKIPPQKVLDFFSKRLKMLCSKDSDGKLYPFSRKAETVVFAMENFIKSSSVDIMTLREAISVKWNNGFFEIELCSSPGPGERKSMSASVTTIRCANLILACGGPSYPRIGGTYSGFELARCFGHTVRPLSPLITSFEVANPDLSILDGLRLQARAFLPDGSDIEGELLFTSYGISGPLALDLSFLYARNCFEKISLDLLPEFSKKELISFFKPASGTYLNTLRSSLDDKLVSFILSISKIRPDSFTDTGGLNIIISLLKNIPLHGLSPSGFEQAMAKTGGVPLCEVDDCFESIKRKGLFLTGEMLDCGGRSGGYNLHFAWTSGLLAGMSIRKD
ncbi:MAG: NAD(P)/FAD-dependent oxidoreductase [Elusimicrobiota bacterium]